MSADNWATCPRFDKHESKEPHPSLGYETMYEYFEIGIERDGEFYVQYRCRCEVCEFEYNYSYRAKAL